MSIRAVDLFAGAGGFTAGAVMAGCDVVWAANHWRAAVDTHSANHPGTDHSCQDLHQADWSKVPQHDLLLASPACQGHSYARGKDRPAHDSSRSTAWAAVSAVEYHKPEFVIIENVTAFTRWALYPAWCDALKALGYSLAPHIIDAADHGVPQNRNRLFIVASKSRAPLMLQFPLQKHVNASEIIDFNAGNWTPIDRPGRSDKTLSRLNNGRHRYGERFLAPYYGSGSGKTGRSLDRPIGTITTRDRWAVIDGNKMRMLNVVETKRAMGFHDSYLLPEKHKEAMFMLGNAVSPPVARDIISALKDAA